MRTSTAQRAEAHLWLLFEEALLALRRDRTGVEAIRRQFWAVADALAEVGVVDRATAGRFRAEFDDALAVRGLLPVAAFRGPGPAVARPTESPTEAAAVWLEAEIERHLDLLAGFDPEARPAAGEETQRILGGPVRALEAAGVLGSAGGLLNELSGSLSASAAGMLSSQPVTTPEYRVRRQWVAFLERRPPPLPVDFLPEHTRSPHTEAGRIDDRSLRISQVSWTTDVLEVVVSIGEKRAASDLYGRWTCRAVNERGGLHLGQPVPLQHRGGTAARFLLRPGLSVTAQRLTLRITCGGRRVDSSVVL